jgi:HlyD family secretion protein
MRDYSAGTSEVQSQPWSNPAADAANKVRTGVAGVRNRFRVLVRCNWKRFTWAMVILGLTVGIYSYVNSPASVNYAVVRTVTTNETLGATGKVRGSRVADLGVDMSGVVKEIYVHGGDSVKAGQLALSLDKSEVEARAQAARDALVTAQAELAKVSRGPLPSEVRQARAELAQAQSVGQARIAQSEARLRNLKSGPRTQEVKVAEAEVKRGKELLSKGEAEYKRTEQLVSMGALAQSSLEQARANLETARADYTTRQQQLSLLQAGPKADQVAEAEAAVAEAKASRDTSVAAAREGLNTILSLPRPEDVRAARARVNEASAELRRTMDVITKADVRAPFDGVVADIPVECGQSVSPGQPMVIVHEMSHPIVEVETDEENLGVLSIGQKAVVSADAYPGRTFDAVVMDLGSRVDSDRGTIRIRLRPLSSPSWLRPDQTVDVNVIIRRNSRRIILPVDAVTRYESSPVVLVARDGVAVPVRVTTGAAGANGVVVNGQLKDGDKVARNASNVAPYSEIHLKRAR